MILTALLQTRFAQFIRNTRKSRNITRIENKKFNNWVGERILSKHRFQSYEVPALSLTEVERLNIRNIRKFFKFSNTYCYRAITLENQFFHKLPTELRTRV